jgi:hypothetical protein
LKTRRHPAHGESSWYGTFYVSRATPHRLRQRYRSRGGPHGRLVPGLRRPVGDDDGGVRRGLTYVPKDESCLCRRGGYEGESHLGNPWPLAIQWRQRLSSWVLASRAGGRVEVADARGHGVPAGEDLGADGDVVMVR